MIATVIPMRLVNELNDHKHWRQRAGRAKAQRYVVANFLRRFRAPGLELPVTVRMVRRSPKSYDTDGTVASFKFVRDAVAEWMSRDDSPGAGVEWTYAWERSTVYEIRIEIMGGERG